MVSREIVDAVENRECDACGSRDQVTRFAFFGSQEPVGDSWLCWDCRWPYLRTRIHGPDATGEPGAISVPEPEPEPVAESTSESDAVQGGLEEFF